MNYPPLNERDDVFYDQEILRLSEQKAAFQEKVKLEPDAKKRSRLSGVVNKTDSIMQNLKEERATGDLQKKTELNKAGEEIRKALTLQMSRIKEAEKPPTPAAPTPTPTPSPETYETEQGFRVRLRFPE